MAIAFDADTSKVCDVTGIRMTERQKKRPSIIPGFFAFDWQYQLLFSRYNIEKAIVALLVTPRILRLIKFPTFGRTNHVPNGRLKGKATPF
jgi:hypothetical protein